LIGFLVIAFLTLGSHFAMAAPNLTFSIPGQCTEFVVQDSAFKGCDEHVTLMTSGVGDRSIYIAQATLPDGRFVNVGFLSTLSKNVNSHDFLATVTAVGIKTQDSPENSTGQQVPKYIPAVGICEQKGDRQSGQFDSIQCVAEDQHHQVYRLNFIPNKNRDSIQAIPASVIPDVSSFQGTWYLDEEGPKSCLAENSNRILYKQKSVEGVDGHESSCKITKLDSTGSLFNRPGMQWVKMSLSCATEGTEYKATEIVAWSKTDLVRFVKGNGDKYETINYHRCH
jgi:hypothetical protein